MIDIHRLISVWHIEVDYETLPDDTAAVYHPKSNSAPARITLTNAHPLSPAEVRELLAMGFQFFHMAPHMAPHTSSISEHLIFLDKHPSPNHLLARDYTAMLLIELDELSRLLHAGIDDIVTLAEKFICRPLLLERRLAFDDVRDLWDSKTKTHRQINLHCAPGLPTQ
jgi:hypothetical protein